MKKFFYLISFFFLAVTITSVAQEQIPAPADLIRLYEGIPIKTDLHWDWVINNPADVDSMVNAGVDIIHTHIGVKDTELINIGQQMSTIDDLNLIVMPVKSSTGSGVLNWIQHYTDAKYSVWEAEGNDNYGANLIFYNSEMEDSVMVVRGSGSNRYLRLSPSAASLQDTTLIWGPYYSQDVKYLTSQDGILRVIPYLAEFGLKLEHNPYNPPVEDNPEDTICVIQVTQSSVGTGPWRLTCTDVIKEREITRGDFQQLNVFQNFLFHNTLDSAYYTLLNNYCDSTATGPQQHTFHSRLGTEEEFIGRWIRNYIEYKVIWKGNSQYLLSIDKVTLSDERGRELFVDPDSTLIYRQRIIAQANSLNSYNADGLVVGWLGIDEPVSIDIFEPIRLVTQILDDNSQRKRP
jgi:hypothetical protein